MALQGGAERRSPPGAPISSPWGGRHFPNKSREKNRSFLRKARKNEGKGAHFREFDFPPRASRTLATPLPWMENSSLHYSSYRLRYNERPSLHPWSTFYLPSISTMRNRRLRDEMRRHAASVGVSQPQRIRSREQLIRPLRHLVPTHPCWRALSGNILRSFS